MTTAHEHGSLQMKTMVQSIIELGPEMNIATTNLSHDNIQPAPLDLFCMLFFFLLFRDDVGQMFTAKVHTRHKKLQAQTSATHYGWVERSTPPQPRFHFRQFLQYGPESRQIGHKKTA